MTAHRFACILFAVAFSACGDDDSSDGAQSTERDAGADASTPSEPPLKAERLLASDASYAFGAADHNRRPMDLAPADYVEEEFVIEGRAKTYDWPESGGVVTRTEPSPYATRVLVRRPKTRSKFSGRVVVELLNPTNRFDLQIGWALSHEHFMREGDAWVGITSKPVAAVAMQKFDAERYAALSWANPLPESDSRNCEMVAGDSSRSTENGLVWDIVRQVGRSLREDPNALLDGYPVKRLYAFGYSQTGGFLGTYINAIHPLDVEEFGKPIFDAYFIGAYTGVSAIHQCTTAPRMEARAQIRDVGVPVMRILTQSDHSLFAAGARENSAELPDAFWHYEVAGAAHATPAELDYAPAVDDLVKAGVTPPVTECEVEPGMKYPRSPFPVGRVFNAAWVNLDCWVEDEVVPPSAAPIDVANMDAALDEHGNAKGGLRTPYVEVPTRTWHGHAAESVMSNLICYLAGYEVPFDAEKLRTLYGSQADYVEKVRQSAEAAVAARFLLQPDADAIVDEARRADWP